MVPYKEIAKYKKNFDFITNYFHYPIAILLCSFISNTSITPNYLTLIAIGFEIFAVVLIIINFTIIFQKITPT